MPIDPNIALGVRPPQFNDPMQTLAQMMALRQNQQNNAYQQERIELQRQEEARLTAAARQKAQDAAAEQAGQAAVRPYLSVKDFDIDGFITTKLPTEQQSAAYKFVEDYRKTHSEIANREALTKKTLQEVLEAKRGEIGKDARQIRSAGYDPDFSQGILKLRSEVDSDFDPDTIWRSQAVNPETGEHDPVRWKRYVDSVIDSVGQAVTMREGEQRVEPSGQTSASIAATPPKPELVEQYDPATGRTVKMYVTPTVGATFQQPPKTVDPTLAALRDIQLANARAGRSPGEVATFNQIAGQYERSPLIRAQDRTIVLKDAIKSIREKPEDATRQLALSYAFVQGIDTYQSSVREGELQNVALLTTRLQQLQVEANRIASTGAFVPKELALQIADTGEQLVKTIEDGAKRKQQEFGSRARASGVESMWNTFVGGMAPRDDAGAGGGAQPKATHRWNPDTKKLEPVP